MLTDFLTFARSKEYSMQTHRPRFNRRRFLHQTASAAALFTVVPRHVLGTEETPAANDKLNIAGIGVGGQGGADIHEMRNENIVALCDVDSQYSAKTFEKYPSAKQYVDYRRLLDEMDKEIDAVVIGTPDHTHAILSIAAIQRGKHVYCEKPLAHSVHEVRAVQQAARAQKVVTQLGNQGHSFDSIRTCCEWIWDGAIGQVTEVHACCDAFKEVYCQSRNLSRRGEVHEVPATLNWDLWLGPAAFRAYHPMYAPWNWRGWLPFGTGALGDWICHVVDPVFWALDLGAPQSVTAEVEGYDPVAQADVYPEGTVITFEFAAKGDRGPVKLVWYDGNKRPPHPPDLEPDRNPPGIGAIVIGDKGTMTYGSHGAGGVRLVPETRMKEYTQPEPKLPRVPGHQLDWLQAIRAGRPAGSSFDYGGALTELGLLGVIAIKFPSTKLAWDGDQTRFTNCEEANRLVHPEFREGWAI